MPQRMDVTARHVVGQHHEHVCCTHYFVPARAAHACLVGREAKRCDERTHTCGRSVSGVGRESEGREIAHLARSRYRVLYDFVVVTDLRYHAAWLRALLRYSRRSSLAP